MSFPQILFLIGLTGFCIGVWGWRKQNLAEEATEARRYLLRMIKEHPGVVYEHEDVDALIEAGLVTRDVDGRLYPVFED